MKVKDLIISGYENSRLVHYNDYEELENTYAYEDLDNLYVQGVLKASFHKDGKLMQTYTTQDNHVGVIAGTRLGKSSSYVVPTILSFAKQKVKRGMIISDPKGELYRITAETLRQQGYRVLLLNFRDYLHSECWNILTPIYRKYKSIKKIVEEVEVVKTEGGLKNKFRGRIYSSQIELDADIERAQDLVMNEVGSDIDNIGAMFITTEKTSDPYWEDSARETLKAFIWAMLEDSDEETRSAELITEETFSFNTIINILRTFNDGKEVNYNDNGYFTKRNPKSQAYGLAKNAFLDNAPTTRKCVISTFTSKLSVFNEVAIRLITSCNSFEIGEILDCPTAIFINYRDELKVHYKLISLFIQDVYRFLIEKANSNVNGVLDVPFYFILDEYGNFPEISDFDATISACAGRRIFFILILQSYAQLNNVYGESVAEIIKDNLNVHVFFGSNNKDTIAAFSQECGECTRISPLCALNGEGAEITNYHTETIPLVPKSSLTHFEPGEGVVTEANSGYVMWTKLERYFLCEEMKSLPQTYEKDYQCVVNPFAKKYTYEFKTKKKINPFEFD